MSDGFQIQLSVLELPGEKGGVCPKQSQEVNMETKPCQCGGTMDQIIKFIEHLNGYMPRRVGWYCPDCREFDKAVGRERTVKEIKPLK